MRYPEYPVLQADLHAIAQNARVICGLYEKQGISVAGVIKVSDGSPEVAGAYLDGGCRQLASSRTFVGLNLQDPSKFDPVVEALRSIPEVVECHYTTGDYDIFIKIYAQDNHHLLNVIHDKLQPLGLSRSETIISFGSAFTRQLPIMGEDEAKDAE